MGRTLDAGEKESRGYCFLARTRQEWVGERSENMLSDAGNNLTLAAGRLSVTYDAQVSDSSKLKMAATQTQDSGRSVEPAELQLGQVRGLPGIMLRQCPLYQETSAMKHLP